jgi:EAL domain-containing protein (putative c-di-GMP-specific phosphodiesterase class I)
MMFRGNRKSERREASDRRSGPAGNPRRDSLVEAMIAQEQVALAFQPQINCRTGQVEGVEALARWRDGSDAVKLFERASSAGLAEQLSRLVQRRALRIASAWEGVLRGLPVSINLLPHDLTRPNYHDWLLEQVELAGIDPARVTIEITESALLTDRASASEQLKRLREAGLSVALDDFGTGYASLDYLTSLPLDTLKIDRGLIAGICRSNRSRIVVRSTIEMARELGLKLVVEGVESEEQLQMLNNWGCERYQGFLGAPALQEFELARFVAQSMVQAA